MSCHPERSWVRFLRPTESKDLRLHFGHYAANFRLRTLAQNAGRSSGQGRGSGSRQPGQRITVHRITTLIVSTQFNHDILIAIESKIQSHLPTAPANRTSMTARIRKGYPKPMTDTNPAARHADSAAKSRYAR